MAQAVLPAPYRFSRQEYDHLTEEGFFEGKKVELLDGVIVTMSPQNSPHASAIYSVLMALLRVLGSAFCVRPQLPIVLDDWSEPEPDLAICRPDRVDYKNAHPRAEQVLVVVEVASSSLPYDRGAKAAAYARSGIPAYWIVNLQDGTIEVLTRPDRAAGRYTLREVSTATDPLVLPGGTSVTVAELLPHA